MGVNPNKSSNNHRLLCYKMPKDQRNVENLIRKDTLTCPFYGQIIGEVEPNEDALGGKLQVQYKTFILETFDFVDEIDNGDLIYITNFDKAFNVDNKAIHIQRDNMQFIKYKSMPKYVRFTIRGKI